MANIIDGKKISQEIKDELREKVESLIAEGKKVALAVIQVGNEQYVLCFSQNTSANIVIFFLIRYTKRLFYKILCNFVVFLADCLTSAALLLTLLLMAHAKSPRSMLQKAHF